MESETINSNHIKDDNKAIENNDGKNCKKVNDMEKSNSEIASASQINETIEEKKENDNIDGKNSEDVENCDSEIESAIKIKETTEENKENDQNSNKKKPAEQYSKLRLVPLEKLLAAPYQIYKNTNESKNSSSIIVLDDSDDDKDLIVVKKLENKSIKVEKKNVIEKLQIKRIRRRISQCSNSSSSNDTNNIHKMPEQRNNSIRCSLRKAKYKTNEKIKKVLATSSSENDDDENDNEMRKSNNKSHITITSGSEEDISNKRKFKSFNNKLNGENQNQNLPDENHICTSTSKPVTKPTTSKNNESNIESSNLSVVAQQSNANQLKRSTDNEKSKKSENKQLENEKPNTDISGSNVNSKKINSEHIRTKKNLEKITNKSLDDCEENSNSNKCESIAKEMHKNKYKNNNNNKSKLSNNLSKKTVGNENIKLKKLKIRLKRLSPIELKNINKEIWQNVLTKSKNNNRSRILKGVSSLSSESEVEEEHVNKKNMMVEQGNNMRRDSNTNDNEDDNNKDDDSIKTKTVTRKSATIMSSSEDDIIQQDEDQSSDNDSNNSSELFRKRTVASRMKKSTQRSDEEYIINSGDEGENTDKKTSDNDDDDDYESDNKKKIKRKQTTKRKRIKNASDSSDDEAGGSNKKRKNIRKLIKNTELNVDAKQAVQEEKDRRKRIEERQKLYNSIYKKPETAELSELILDFDEETKKPLLKVDSGLLKLLKPHQANGVKFMWDACYETLKDAEDSHGSGCILAHCMGLGKTLQVIALTHTLLTHSRKTNVERVLIITPLSTLTNWAREYNHWIKFCKHKNVEIYDMSKFKDKTLRTYKLNEWYEEGGVCIMGYDMYRILSNEKTKGLRKKQRETLQQCLVDPGADIVICDEGHLLKNEKTSISKAVTKMRTKRRIVLTGTPLQNNLKEYYCMIQFIKPNLLGTYKEYLNRFVNPITNGQYTDSTERDIRLMKHRSHILHTLLEGCLQRRDYSVLAPYLPPKNEYVIYITLSDIQRKLYEYYMTRQRNHIEDMTGKGAKLFQDFQNLRRIWTHPMCLRVNSDIAIKKRLLRSDSEGSLKDFVVDDTTSVSSDSDSSSFNSDKTNESVKHVKRTRNRRLATDDSDIEEVPIAKEDPSEWWCQLVPKEEISNINHSPKLLLLMKVLEKCEQIGDKLLLFSQSLQSLDVIEEFLSFINRRTQNVEVDCNINDFTGIWQPGVDYFRLDGSSSVEQRDTMCKTFNNVNNLRARLFLISTRAGSLGINLVAANRVIIFDVSWNPSHDTQSIFRVYRFGQEKPCYIYRFIAMGTMEQKVYERQVAKQAMAKRVIDEHQIGRHYNQNDLLELYTYELESKIPRELPILPKDRLFADLLSNYENLIYKYHEHDSLLENQESDNLSEEERKAAWDEYETEKNRPPQQQYVMYNRPTYTIGPGGYQAHNGPVTSNKIFGFRTDILLRLLNMKVGRDHPRLTPNEIVQMVPSYLQQLYSEMNQNNPTMYKELLELHQQLEMPQGYYMNPLLYSNQNEMAQANGGNRTVNPYANRPPPTISAEIVEID